MLVIRKSHEHVDSTFRRLLGMRLREDAQTSDAGGEQPIESGWKHEISPVRFQGKSRNDPSAECNYSALVWPL